MSFRFTFVVLAWVSLLAGCTTAPRKSATAIATNQPPAETRRRAESPQDAERRAEAHARFLHALSLEMNDEGERAAKEYERALHADPGNEELAMDLSRRFIQRKQFDRAIPVLKTASESPDASAAVFARLGFVYLQMGNTNAAVEANRAAIKRQPGSIAGYQNLYTLYRQTGQTNEGRRVLDDAARQSKADAAFLVDLASLYILEDAPNVKATNTTVSARAREALTRAAAQSPTNLFTLQKLAQGFRIVGETKQASEVLLKLLAAFPDLPGVREELADLYLRSNDPKRAGEQLEALVRDNPTNPQAHYILGAIAYDAKRYADAIEHYRKALLLSPGFEQVYYDIAAAKIALNEPREALDYLQQAQRRFRPSFVSEFFSGVAYVRLKQFTNAIEHFSAAEVVARVTDSNRLTHTFYFQCGSAHERAGKIPEAEKYFEKCLQLSPNFPEALNYLGYMWAERGTNLDRARVLIEKAVSIEPTNAAYLDSLGWVLFKQGHAREALPQIEKAIELSSEPDATLFDHLGDVYAALKQHDKAHEAWRKALAIEPNKEIEQKLKGANATAKTKPES